ncbi:MAG: hypothetical protein V1848_02355 [Candidatus Magasanikbacteria bacterium]
MAKLKTNQAVAKRLKIKRSKSGIKVIKRTDGQDHFNSRETGKVRRNKRSDNTLSSTLKQTILRAMPHA